MIFLADEPVRSGQKICMPPSSNLRDSACSPAARRYRRERIAHWDQAAGLKDAPDRPAAFYHALLRRYFRFLVPEGSRVLELGCANGDLLAAVKPSFGVGVDFSVEMIRLASRKHPDLHFILGDVHELSVQKKLDIIILSDLLNDLWDVQCVLENLRKFCHYRTRVVINFYNNLWRIPLAVVRRLGLGADILEQNWFSPHDVVNLLQLSGFETVKHQAHILLPLDIPFAAGFSNRYLVHLVPFRWFALHPINVESVAWVAARKNVLSTCCLLLTIGFYVRFTERPSALRYTAVLLVFTLGLMAKPMLVTLPFLLFLFDYWPLGRFSFTKSKFVLVTIYRGSVNETNNAAGSMKALIYEKIPLLALTLIVAYLSVAGLKLGTIPFESGPLSLRAENALVSYVRYIVMMFCPTGLAFYYPFPSVVPMWQSTGAAALLLAITVAAVRGVTASPWFALGWFWYMGTLVPVIGSMQTGLWPAVADRWAYVPLMGIFIALVWGAESMGRRLRLGPMAYAAAGLGVLAILAAMTHHQIGFWRTALIYTAAGSRRLTTTRWPITTSPAPWQVKDNTQKRLNTSGWVSASHPRDPDLHNNLSNSLIKLGDMEGAKNHIETALRLDPGSAKAHNNYGVLLAKIENPMRLRSSIPGHRAKVRLRRGL